jgi:hypothetical protein
VERTHYWAAVDSAGFRGSKQRVIVVLSALSNNTLDEVICQGDSMQMGGEWYKSSGIYRDTIKSSSQCDSIVTLHLRVAEQPEITLKGDTLFVAKQDTGYHFRWYNIYNRPIPNIDRAWLLPQVPGNYRVETRLKDCRMTSEPFAYTIGNLSDKAWEEALNLYPNPGRSQLQVAWNPQMNIDRIQILNSIGQTVYTQSAPENHSIMDLSALPVGMYQVLVHTESGVRSKPWVKR